MKIKSGKVRFNVHSISAWMNHSPNLALGSGHPRISQERIQHRVALYGFPYLEGTLACLPLLLRVRVVAILRPPGCSVLCVIGVPVQPEIPVCCHVALELVGD